MKKILIIDTRDSRVAIVSLKIGEKKEKQETRKKLHSQVVLQLINKTLEENKLNPEDLDEVEVFTGPGSFTGIRIGIAIANTFGWALNIKVNGQKQLVEASYK